MCCVLQYSWVVQGRCVKVRVSVVAEIQNKQKEQGEVCALCM